MPATTADQKPRGGPQSLLQMNFAFTSSRILCVAVQLDVFSRMADGNATAGEIAVAAKCSQRGMKMLLDALVALELLVKDENRYHLTPLADRYLVRSSEDYAGGMFETDDLRQAWDGLLDAVHLGRPVRSVNAQAKAEEYFPHLIRSLHVFNREPCRRAVAAMGIGTDQSGVRALDVGCGSGVWGIAIMQADAEARATFHDFPRILDMTRDYVQRHGVADRCDYLPGDLKETDFGENRFDAALLGNIVHSEGEASSRELFARLRRAVRPGGRLAIMDMIPNEDRTGPPFPVIFALNMLVQTDSGGTYTLGEYESWLTAAGFNSVSTADIGSHSPLILAR